MISIRIGHYLDESPDWWAKFVKEVHSSHEFTTEVEALERVNNALKPYSAAIRYETKLAFVDFEDEAKYNWFLLRWSK